MRCKAMSLSDHHAYAISLLDDHDVPGLTFADPKRLIPDRNEMIAEAAYFKAEKRNFAPGLELQDWLEAEREIDHLFHLEFWQ